MTAHRAYIGIGSNLGNPAGYVHGAIHRMMHLPQTKLVAQSGLYQSAPVDAEGDDYVNAVVCLLTSLPPQALMGELYEIENACGRKRLYHNAPRTLDLDLLLYDDKTMDTATLTLPHPRMTERAFVLVPLLEIAPSVTIPGKGAAHHFLAHVRNQPITLLTT